MTGNMVRCMIGRMSNGGMVGHAIGCVTRSESGVRTGAGANAGSGAGVDAGAGVCAGAGLWRGMFCLMAACLLSVLVASADSIRIGRGKGTAADADKGSAEYFAKPFNGVFDARVTNVKYNDPAPKWRFYDDGRAIMFHNSMHPLYECYYYTVDGGTGGEEGAGGVNGKGSVDGTGSVKGSGGESGTGAAGGTTIRLRGVCCLRGSSSSGFRMLPDKPADLVLEVAAYGNGAKLKGREAGKGGRVFELTMSSKDYIPRYEDSRDLAAVMECRADGIARSSGNLWLVTENYGAVARTLPGDGDAVVRFDRNNIFEGNMDESGNYVLIDYVKGRKLYVDVSEVKKVTGDGMLQDILYTDAAAGLAFTRWQSTLKDKERAIDTSGYFNGVKAGRMSAGVFIVLMCLALILLLLNRFYPPFFANFLFYATYAAVLVITLYEVWYVFSLGKDALWFITDPKDSLHGLAAGIGMFVFMFLQVDLILSMETSFGNIYSAYSRCPFWVELVLSVLALLAAIPLILSGQPKWILCAYLLMIVATLPTSIGYLRHSSNKAVVLPFLLICYPFKYVMILPLLLLYIFGKASKTRVSFDSDDDDSHKTVRDMEGNTVNLNKTANGDMLDNDGNAFTHSGGSYTPNGANKKDGPYS